MIPATALLTAAAVSASCGGDTLDALDLFDASDGSLSANDATLRDTGAGDFDADGASREAGDGEGDGGGSEADDGGLEARDATLADAASGADGAFTSDADADADADAAHDAAPDADADADADAGDGGFALQSATKFAVLAGSTITASSSPTTVVVGDMGVSPGTSIDALPAGQPVGTVYAGGSVALQAQADLTRSFNALAGEPCLPANNLASLANPDLGGKTLAPGVYCFPATSAELTGALVLDAKGDPSATWIFQVGTALTTATNATVSVINGGSACNVYWQIGTSATLGTGTAFVGNIVAATSITLVTGTALTPGRALARNGAVSIDGNTISAAACQ